MELDNSLIMYLIIFILASGEEVLKSSLVYITKRTFLIIPAILLLPTLEAILSYSDIYNHSLELGVSNELVFVYTLSVIFGAKIFHVFTSVFYYYSDNIIKYVVFGSFIHFIYNIIVTHLPTLSKVNYILVPLIISFASAFIMYVFHTCIKSNK